MDEELKQNIIRCYTESHNTFIASQGKTEAIVYDFLEWLSNEFELTSKQFIKQIVFSLKREKKIARERNDGDGLLREASAQVRLELIDRLFGSEESKSEN